MFFTESSAQKPMWIGVLAWERPLIHRGSSMVRELSMSWRTRTHSPPYKTTEPSDGTPHSPPPSPLLDALPISSAMFPSSNQTESWPRKRDGAILASVPDKSPRDYQLAPGVERITPTYYQPTNPSEPSHRSTKCAHGPDKAPHDERPLPVDERMTQSYHKQASPPEPSHRPTKYAQATGEAPRDEPPPVVETITPIEPVNPPGPSYQSYKLVHVPGEVPCIERPLGRFGTIVMDPPGSTHPPAKSPPVLPPNMSVISIRKMPTTVRSQTLSHPFINNPVILVPNV